jgi:DNA-binding response OmpR family regulator
MSEITKILIVDDEPAIVMAIEFLMTRRGYQVRTAFDGEQALQIAAEFQPNLILLDVMMPLMDGFEVAARLRSNEAYSQTHIIFLTAKGTERDKQTGYASGAEYYIVKPFDNDLLVSTVEEILTYG